jgi:hypothetical protein
MRIKIENTRVIKIDIQNLTMERQRLLYIIAIIVILIFVVYYIITYGDIFLTAIKTIISVF